MDRDSVIAEIQRMASEMAAEYSPYAGYGPSESFYNHHRPMGWYRGEALAKLFFGWNAGWSALLTVCQLKAPSRALALAFSKRNLAHNQPQPVRKSRAPALDGPVDSLPDLRRAEAELYPMLTLIERSRTVKIVIVNGQAIRREVVVYGFR